MGEWMILLFATSQQYSLSSLYTTRLIVQFEYRIQNFYSFFVHDDILLASGVIFQSLNPVTYQPNSNFQQGAAMFTASAVQLRLELLACGGSISVNVITNKLVGLKCLTETKIPILYHHVDHTHFHIVEMEYLMVEHFSAYIVGPTM